MTKDDSTLGLQEQLSLLSQRLDKVESRLTALEQSLRSTPRAKELRRKIEPIPKMSKSKNVPKHNYLRRTIADVKRRYNAQNSLR